VVIWAVVATLTRRPLLVLWLGLVAWTGCATPTLPLPPPDPAPLSAPDADGMVTVSGTARPDALVFIYNEDAEDGVITGSDEEGLFATRIAAESGHTLTFWQRVGTDDGQPVSRQVP
jgi:hypothetical protein